MSPEVSVVIPTYNRKALVLEALESVLAQTFGDLEAIVVDDGSEDGTAEAIESVEDGRVRIVRKEHSGIASTRNRGIRESRGKHVAFLLDSQKAHMVYMPPGVAHGFCALSEEARMAYNVTTMYDPDCDAGILWNSAGIEWPLEDPVLSERDLSFPGLEEFENPFVYAGPGGRP